MKEENAALFITLFAAATMLAAIPAGKVGHKFGRKKAIMCGLIGILTLFIIYFFSRNDAAFSKDMLYIAIIFGGASIAFVTINTLPLVLEIGGTEKIGTYTGYYYTATFSASIVGPILCGRLFDLTKDGIHYWSLFIYCPICFALALLFITQVRHGEIKTIPEDILKEALMADD
jgi:MFS family permease